MIFVVPRELIICVEPVEFDDGKLLELRRTDELNQPPTAESEIVKTSGVITSSDFFSGF